MATLSFTYPDKYKADVETALKASLGDDAEGLTDADAAKRAVKRYVRGVVMAHRRRSDSAVTKAVTDADAALVAKEAAAAEARKARSDAEAADSAAVVADFGD